MYKPNKAKLFGLALKQLLAERNLSQRQFAKNAGLKPSDISKLVNGKIAEPRQENCCKIANGLGITEQELLEYIGQYRNSEAPKKISAPSGLVERKEAIAKLHRESVEMVDALAKDLSSERRVDYSRLRDLLAAGKWRDADRETGTVMLKVADKVRQGWLRSYDIKNFPCTDLQIIDSLWRKHSNGRFGFSIQKRIWLNIRGANNANLQTFHTFADSVGWRVKGFWVARVKHSIDAPEGHLPDLDFGVSPHYVEEFRAAGGFGHDGAWNARRTVLSDLASKLADCNIR